MKKYQNCRRSFGLEHTTYSAEVTNGAQFVIYTVTTSHYVPQFKEIENDLAKFIKTRNKHFYKDFGHLIDISSEFHEITFNETNIFESNCSCKYFQKDYICKHIFLMAVRLKFL